VVFSSTSGVRICVIYSGGGGGGGSVDIIVMVTVITLKFNGEACASKLKDYTPPLS